MNQSSGLILDSIFFNVPELSILEGAYLNIQPGKITAVVGRNGSGKSTLIKIAAGQILASSGITLLDGTRIHRKSPRDRFRKIGYLPQDSMLPKDISVKRLLTSIPSSKSILEEKIVKKVLHQKVIELSGGERRYLEMAIIFSLSRKYLLLDEPFTGVEPTIIDLIIEKIQEQVDEGKGVLITDHLHRYITNLADDAYLMHNKQCYPILGNISEELKKLNYLR